MSKPLIAIITSKTGYQHAILAGQRIRDLPRDEAGLPIAETVCGKNVHGPVSGLEVEHMEQMRCRPCKGILARHRKDYACVVAR